MFSFVNKNVVKTEESHPALRFMELFQSSEWISLPYILKINRITNLQIRLNPGHNKKQNKNLGR